jgi:hypothetical protein
MEECPSTAHLDDGVEWWTDRRGQTIEITGRGKRINHREHREDELETNLNIQRHSYEFISLVLFSVFLSVFSVISVV